MNFKFTTDYLLDKVIKDAISKYDDDYSLIGKIKIIHRYMNLYSRLVSDNTVKEENSLNYLVDRVKSSMRVKEDNKGNDIIVSDIPLLAVQWTYIDKTTYMYRVIMGVNGYSVNRFETEWIRANSPREVAKAAVLLARKVADIF